MIILPCGTGQHALHLRHQLLSFVLPYEKLAVGFVSHILREDTALFLVQADDGTPYNAFSFSDGGQILHCLPDAYGSRQEALLQVLTDFFRTQAKHEFFNIIGEKKGTELIQTAVYRALGRTTQHDQSYLLLEAKTSVPALADTTPARPASAPDALSIVQCIPQWCDTLLPLQLAYEKEEVVWSRDQIDENVTRLTFQRALRTQQIFAVSKNGAYIAKGGTNALGKKYAQLGGMYTVPHERGKGYATALVRHIVSTLRAQGKKCVLFVKPRNSSALRLYKTCGFTQIGQFKIAYY